MRVVVYTAHCGDRDAPRTAEQMLGVTKIGHARFQHPRMNAKAVKVLAHKFVDADYSIWTDYNVFLKVPPEEFVKKLGDKEVGVFRYAIRKRTTVYQEALSVTHRDDPAVMQAQMTHYEAEGFDGKPLCMGFLIVRKHTEAVARQNEQWWAEISRWSWRDQLSLPYVYRDNLAVWDGGVIKGDCRWYHRVSHSPDKPVDNRAIRKAAARAKKRTEKQAEKMADKKSRPRKLHPPREARRRRP